jgi:hypothetical protein
MDALDLLRTQAAFADDILTRVFAAVTADQALWKLGGSTANTIAGTFLHLYSSEDRAIHRLLLGKSPLFETNCWQQRLDYDPEAPWTSSKQPDLAAYRAYAAEVHAATKQALAGLEPAALEREVDGPRGKRPLVTSLSLLLVAHKQTHLGEISALLGCQGAKGFPF